MTATTFGLHSTNDLDSGKNYMTPTVKNSLGDGKAMSSSKTGAAMADESGEPLRNASQRSYENTENKRPLEFSERLRKHGSCQG